MEVSGQRHVRKQGGLQSLSGRCGQEKNLVPLPGFELRTVQLTATSQYRLRYTGSEMMWCLKNMGKKEMKPCMWHNRRKKQDKNDTTEHKYQGPCLQL
jgi:hypothetical protein